MAKEILLYNDVYSYTAQQFITALDQYKEEDISVRINCNGGSPQEGWGMIAKWAEHLKNKSVKVDGKAYSFGAFFLCYTEDATALDVSQFLIHRAAYSDYYEKNYMSEADRKELDNINAKLRAALESKIDIAKFEKLTGYTLDQVFSTDQRIDVIFDAVTAKKIGLIKDFTTITPEKQNEINALVQKIAAQHNGFTIEASKPQEQKPLNTKSNIMDISTLKAQHPDVYAAVISAGVKQERERAGAWAVFIDVDPKAVAKGIKEGEELTPISMAELSRKSFSAKALNDIGADSPAGVTTDEVEPGKTDKEKNISAFAEKVKAGLTKNLTL